MGCADIIPGVSGGTVAFILGFYPRLVSALRAFDGALLALLYRGRFRAAARHTDWVFLLPLGIGVMAAFGVFTHIIPLPTLIRAYPSLVYGLFFGLLTASIGLLMRDLGRMGASDGLWLLSGIIMGYGLVNILPMDTPEAPWFIFASGALAICAMILPGVSGAFILLILKKYAYLLDAIARLDFGVLAPFILGAVVGLLLFSRVLVRLLSRFYRQTFAVITGMLIGTLWVIWPFQERLYQQIGGKAHLIGSTPVWPGALDGMTMATVGLIVTGAAMVMALDRFAKRPELRAGTKNTSNGRISNFGQNKRR